MFDLCEWNDNSEAQSLTESLVRRSGSENGAKKDKAAPSRRKRLKRNRQLLEILHTLETPSILEQDTQTTEIQVHIKTDTENKEKKKKFADTSNQPGGPLEANSPRSPTQPHLSRKQWKNKLKNKRRNKNKFKPSAECKQGEQSAGKELGRNTLNNGQNKLETDKAMTRNPETRTEDGGQTNHRNKTKEKRKGKARNVEKESREDMETEPCAGIKKESQGYNQPSERLNVAQKRRLQKLKKIMEKEVNSTKEDVPSNMNGAKGPSKDNATEYLEGDDPVEEILPKDRSTTLRSRMEKRLSSARFRYINQQLYTSDSQEAFQLFDNDPEAFTIYHQGFSQQVQCWPVNPVTKIIQFIKNRPSSLVVADFGCGDALIAQTVKNKVHSFDLVALNDHVTVCDMAKVPLSDESVDIAVFCLSLMGKNISEFLQEANRVLKLGAVLLVAEVSSRFDDIRQFQSAMSQLGFKNISKNTDNSHFYLFEFSKSGNARDCKRHLGLELKPCLYKKR
ncbi:hypothetical protein GDO86_004780 [Hymenochirus boettgeri]|uniref:Ribosomal RNA-processing protein 8 n=2 Tax=Hymenochirus boettgeri TaxID=247094 RepID=A0A8T2K9N0_9PIPI|nr:hypothetical protein GDO86_004780 [Hymenochirus boettgeri]